MGVLIDHGADSVLLDHLVVGVLINHLEKCDIVGTLRIFINSVFICVFLTNLVSVVEQEQCIILSGGSSSGFRPSEMIIIQK